MSKNPNLMVYYKEEVPESLHYQNSNRIGNEINFKEFLIEMK